MFKLSGPHCSSMQASHPPCLISWSIQEVILASQLSIFTPRFYTTEIFQGYSWGRQSLLFWSPWLWFCYFFSSFSSFLCLFTHHCGSLQLKLLPAFTCSATYFLFVSSRRSSRVLFLTGPSVTRVRRLFSKHSRNLLDCLSPAVLSLWQIRNGVSCPDNQDFHHEMV